MSKRYLKGDWSIWEQTPPELLALGFGEKTFVSYTLRHRIRLLFGIHGQMHDGEYLFNFTRTYPSRLNRLLNRLINKIPLEKI